jgi:hypothetical protein
VTQAEKKRLPLSLRGKLQRRPGCRNSVLMLEAVFVDQTAEAISPLDVA